MPPKRVLDWTCESFSYGNGPTSCAKYFAISPARAKLPGRYFFCSGALYTDCVTQRPTSVSPQAVSPSVVFTSGPAAITIVYVGIGLFSRQRVVVRAFFPLPDV